MNLITVYHLRKLAIRSEPWLFWNHWEGSHLLQQITILLWINPGIKWNLFPPSWFSKWGKKPDYSFSKAFRVPCVLLIVFFLLFMDLDMQREVRKGSSLFSVNLQCCSEFGTGSPTSSTFERKLTTATWDLLNTVSRQSRFCHNAFFICTRFPLNNNNNNKIRKIFLVCFFPSPLLNCRKYSLLFQKSNNETSRNAPV